MATHDDVRQICARLPEAVEGTDSFGFSVPVKGKFKGFCWTWNERVEPKKPKVPNPAILAIVTPGLAAKEAILSQYPDAFESDPHYDGYPAVLIRLATADVNMLEDLLIEAWRAKAPKKLSAQYEASSEVAESVTKTARSR